MFNLLLQSDFCKVQASDLIQRATTSIWPGTTLNLLKFPIMRPSGNKQTVFAYYVFYFTIISGWRQYLRFKRLHAEKEVIKQQKELQRQQLRSTRNIEYATLIGTIFNKNVYSNSSIRNPVL